MAAVEGIGIGVQAAVGKDSKEWVGALASGVARLFAVQSEEADKRNWRTLPDEIQIARLWVPPGSYTLTLPFLDKSGRILGKTASHRVTLAPGETRFIAERVMF